MRRFFIRLGLASLVGNPFFAISAASAQDAIPLRVDTAHSRASFAVTHVYVARVTGAVPIIHASVTLQPGSAIPSAIEATLDPRRIDSGNPDRDGDLQGPDWFDTTKFPAWIFRSTRVDATSGDRFTVDGLLTVHGAAVPLALAVTIVRGLPHPAYHAVARVDRHAFGMRVTPTDALVGSIVDLTLDIQLE